MRVAGSENAIGHRKARRQFERGEQVCRRLVEPAAEEVALRQFRSDKCHAITRAEAQIALKMLEREIGLAGKNPEQCAPVPAAGVARVESEATVDQPE